MPKKAAISQFQQWYQSRWGHLILGLAELILAYLVGSRALDTGSWWEYSFTVLLLAGFIRNLVGFFKKK
jgi:hypothetical protein